MRTILAGAAELAASSVAIDIKTRLRQELVDHLLKLGPTPFQAAGDVQHAGDPTSSAGAAAAALTEGVEALDAYFSQYLPQLALAALVPLGTLLFVFPIDFLSGAILLVTAPLIPLFMVLIGSQADVLTKRQWRSLSRMSAFFLDIIQGLTTLKMLGRSRQQVKTIAQVSEQFRRTTMSVLRVAFLSALALELLATLSTAVIAVQIGLRLLSGRGGLSFEQAFFILVLAPEFYLPLRNLGARFHAGMAGTAAAQQIFHILEQAPPPLTDLSGRTSLASRTVPQGAICFEQVSYHYNDAYPALEGVSFTVAPGEKYALVGKSGAGKSTIANLLLGFIQPATGRVTIGSSPMSPPTGNGERALFAWVPQNPYLFNASVEDNLRLGCPDCSREEIEQAARMAFAHDFIQRLPHGYQTVIGERGTRLSGGQAQRIAIARALLTDAPILLLDEATANLDPESEAQLQQASARLAEGRTVITIAHRLNTVRQADCILVLSGGKIIERGTHAELVAEGGAYYHLVKAYSGASPFVLSSFDSLSTSQTTPQLASPPSSPALLIPKAAATRQRPFWLRLAAWVSPLKGGVALSIGLGAATITSGMGLMSAAAYIIAGAALHPSIAVLQVPIVAVRFFGITRGVFRYLERYISHDITFQVLANLRIWFYQALEPLAPARLWQYRSGDLLSRMTSDIASLENFYVRSLAPPCVALIVTLISGGFMLWFHWSLALALLGWLSFAGILVPLFSVLGGREPGRRLLSIRSRLNQDIIDSLQGAADLLAFGAAGRQREKIAEASRQLAEVQRRSAWVNAAQTSLSLFAAQAGLWTVLVLAIHLTANGNLPGIALGVLALAALTSFESVQPLPAAAQHLETHLQAARRLFGVIDAQPEVSEPSDPISPPASTELHVQALSFRYPPEQGREPASPLVLEDLEFSLAAGKRLAVVGPSGSGKSTLVHLLLRFWDYHHGVIQWGSGDLKSYSPELVRRSTSAILQNNYLFNASVRENLLIANPSASPAEMEEAARLAQIHERILALPQGYDTWIGEHGLKLSAGERQRLAIARALLKHAPLLILDEPTVNLDAITERQVFASLLSSARDRSLLVITHRLSGLELMDEILVLQDGKCLERGCHQELLDRQGAYFRMWMRERQILF